MEIKQDIIDEAVERLKSPLTNGVDLLIYENLKKIAYGFNYISYENIDIDFTLCANTVQYVKTIINEMEKYYKEHEGTNALEYSNVCFAWCILTGIGISYFYHRNNKTKDSSFLMDSVLKPRGCFALDEFVLEEIVSKEGLNSEDVSDQIKVISEFALLAMNGHTNPNEKTTQFLYVCRACFLFGTSFETILIENAKQ